MSTPHVLAIAGALLGALGAGLAWFADRSPLAAVCAGLLVLAAIATWVWAGRDTTDKRGVRTWRP